ncbi:hypothetical protein PPYR_08816 [Photinus pyralis]|uniref:RING-type E3 ubiquitin transferase n=1 Tax=Photinus pyralis TaxID=7054 RepID=A0A1Y1N8D6_PHOPY|nr:E3 ubiquitin-protein ligase RNF168-like [Photinus pyralis]KAB0797823.1 hypothetical protein PPYR_08816 [Photinus pyralis]
MAPRRSARCVNPANSVNYDNLKLNDVLCPICRSILIEPVTLPCNHGFCSSCFESTVANTNLVCPLCRVRIGSWLRTSKKDNKLVNVVLWNVIQKQFPKQVKNKLDGVEEYPEEVQPPRRITVPGEIRREYEAEKHKTELELQKERAAEEKASQSLIKKIRDEEEYEEVLREENVRLSEQVAKKLAQEYCFDPGPSSSGVTVKKQGPIDKLLQNLNHKKVTVTIQPGRNASKEYTCKNLCQNKPIQNVNRLFNTTTASKNIQDKLKKVITEREAADSNDSIDSECRFFKPIEPKYVPLPKKVPVIKVPAVTRTVSTVIIGPPKGETNFKHSSLESAFVVVKIMKCPVSTQISKCDTTITELPPSLQNVTENKKLVRCRTPTKRKRGKSPQVMQKKSKTDRNSPFRGFDSNMNGITTKINGSITHHNKSVGKDIKKRQEDDDFQLALKLQDELNKRYYNTRNNYSVQIKKPLARQVTLKEIMSQNISKVPQ